MKLTISVEGKHIDQPEIGCSAEVIGLPEPAHFSVEAIATESAGGLAVSFLSSVLGRLPLESQLEQERDRTAEEKAVSSGLRKEVSRAMEATEVQRSNAHNAESVTTHLYGYLAEGASVIESLYNMLEHWELAITPSKPWPRGLKKRVKAFIVEHSYDEDGKVV